MTYFNEDGIHVDGDHTKDVMRNHDGGEYIKLRWDPQSEVTTTTDRKGSRLWYWVKSGLCFLCLGLLALVAIKWVGPLFIEKVSSYSSFQMPYAMRLHLHMLFFFVLSMQCVLNVHIICKLYMHFLKFSCNDL